MSQAKVIHLEDSQGRGRNGEFRAAEAIITTPDKDTVQLSIVSGRGGRKQPPVMLTTPKRHGAEIALALAKRCGVENLLKGTHTDSYAKIACEGLDETELAKLGRGGMANLLKELLGFLADAELQNNRVQAAETIRRLLPGEDASID